MPSSEAPLLLLRADASPTIGMGHVMRGLGLAQQWQDMGGRAAMLMARPNAPVEERVRREAVGVEVLGVDPASAADAGATASAARRLGACWIVADGYAFGTDWLARVGESGIPLALWTDYVQAPRLPVSLLLNQNPHACASDFAVPAAGATLLLGLRHAVLRREFRSRQGLRRVRSQGVRRVLVTLGGADPANATRIVLEALALMGGAAPAATIVVGANNPRMAELRELAARLSGAELLHAVEDMPALIDTCDLAISAAGATLWELAYLGVPALATVLADNQAPLAAAVGAARAGIDLGWSHSLAPARLATLLTTLLGDPARVEAMSHAALDLVDGQGAARVCTALREHLQRKQS